MSMVSGSPGSSPKRRQGKRPPDEALHQVILAKAGIVSAVAEACGVTTRAVQRWSKQPRVAAMFEEVRNARLDLAESTIIQAIKNRNITAAIFYLKCHGKHRGWVERQEITGKDGGPIGPSVEDQVLRSLSDDELKQLSEVMEKAADRLRIDEGKGPAVASRVH